MLSLGVVVAIICQVAMAQTPTPAYNCGILAPCLSSTNVFGGCYNPARQGCCDGTLYFYVDSSGVTRNCCKDANGLDVIISHPNYIFMDCPTTPTPTTLAPNTTNSTTVIPTITTPSPSVTNSTPTPIPNNTTSTPVTTTTTPVATTVVPSKCSSVSVNGDATYCIDGPICSGNGILPAGTECPKKGAIATADCHPNLPSSTSNGGCILPSNSVCEKIATGAWACVLKL